MLSHWPLSRGDLSTDTKFLVGAGDSNQYKAKLAHLMFWNRELTADEIGLKPSKPCSQAGGKTLGGLAGVSSCGTGFSGGATLQDGLAAAYELDGSYASRLAGSPAFVNSQAGWVHICKCRVGFLRNCTIYWQCLAGFFRRGHLRHQQVVPANLQIEAAARFAALLRWNTTSVLL